MSDISKDVLESAFELIELVKSSGKIKKGTNEVTKAIEKQKAKFVIVAEDVTPPEIVMHLPLLAKEKEIPCIKAGTKEELGTAAGLKVGTSSLAIIDEGEAKEQLKKVIASLN
jgi:large subunit ribosomal protein L7Ae